MNNEILSEERLKKSEQNKKMVRNKTIRLKRTPLHKQKRIGIREEEGYHYRLVNDVGDRVDSFLTVGYEFVDAAVRDGAKDASDSAQHGKIACQNVGNGVKAYYMRIKNDLWQADQKEKQVEIDHVEKMIGLDKIPQHIRRGKIEITHQ